MRFAALVLLFLAVPGLASPGDSDFLAARDAFAKGQIARLNELAPGLRTHPLALYVEYWQLRSRLTDDPSADVQQFLERNSGQLLANRLRADWLRQLAKQKDWTQFMREYPALVDAEVDIQCLSLQARLTVQDPGIARDAKALWLSPRELPDSCAPVFEALIASGELTEEDLWSRVRLAFEAGNATLAKSVAHYLPAARRPEPKAVDAVVRNPQKYLDSRVLPTRTRAQREVALFALGKTAGITPAGAADTWHKLQRQFPEDERGYGWGLVAHAGARRHMPEALDWFRDAGKTPLNDNQLGWKVRAALRGGDWREVTTAIEAMSPEERERQAWRYWRARALLAQGRDFEGNALLTILASEHGFHALLAADELGSASSVVRTIYKPLEGEIGAMERHPGLQRAIALYRLGLRYEGNLEWQWSIRGMGDTLLLASAELARREGWYERAIATADKADGLVSMELRYPTPYAELIRASAREVDIDEAWVYGLVRQESRFVPTARSNAGASGLMQIMPATAKWVANRLGLKDWRPALDVALDANLNIGTYYMKEMLTKFDGSPVLASAAYNAGPRRAQEWRAPGALEAAIYIDTIPFNETRDYVRKVMANAAQYARVLGHSQDSLKARLGTIPARKGEVSIGPQEP
jgi:soluble lytic murein transglycosylase